MSIFKMLCAVVVAGNSIAMWFNFRCFRRRGRAGSVFVVICVLVETVHIIFQQSLEKNNVNGCHHGH